MLQKAAENHFIFPNIQKDLYTAEYSNKTLLFPEPITTTLTALLINPNLFTRSNASYGFFRCYLFILFPAKGSDLVCILLKILRSKSAFFLNRVNIDLFPFPPRVSYSILQVTMERNWKLMFYCKLPLDPFNVVTCVSWCWSSVGVLDWNSLQNLNTGDHYIGSETRCVFVPIFYLPCCRHRQTKHTREAFIPLPSSDPLFVKCLVPCAFNCFCSQMIFSVLCYRNANGL